METILIVDDESESLRLLSDILTGEGYRVRPADSATLALASVATELPDLILVDVSMPEMDGFDFCRRIKASDRSAVVPLIFVSASADANTSVRGLTLGAVDYVSKPFRREELLARVRTHLELGRLRGQLEAEVKLRTSELTHAIEQLKQEVAERQHAESALSESQQRFRLMADTAPVLVWGSGPDKACTFFNRAWLTFTGRTIEQELGNGWTEGVHPDDLDHCFSTYTSHFERRAPFKMEYRLRRRDGEYRWVIDEAVPCIEPGGDFVGYIGSCLDVTDLRQAQQEALARARVESLRVLAGGIAHDFTNLMSTILATAEIAELGVAEQIMPAVEITTMKAVAQQAITIARELMIYAGQDKGTFEHVNLSQVVEEMLGILKTSFPKGCALTADLHRTLPAVWSNATHIRQVIMNLVINAAEAIGNTGGSIHIRTSLVPSGTEHYTSDYVKLTVSDTGRGISSEQQQRIFDPFFTTKDTGHGLGLAVVHGIVHSHGGLITVASEPGLGTTFEVLFPSAPARTAETTAKVRSGQS